MNKLGILLLTATLGAGAALASGCGDDAKESTSTTTTTTSSSTSGGEGGSGGAGGSGSDLGTMPSYGAQVDRFGRPAINTALNAVFEADMAKKGMQKDMWNANADPTSWGKDYAGEVAKNLAIFDGLDTMCGNQFGAGPNVSADRYATLAGVLADDRQWINTAATDCTTYLAVEANATGLIPNSDCGGRKLSYDIIDVSYSALAIGMVSGVTDGIDTPTWATGKTFPYLAVPK